MEWAGRSLILDALCDWKISNWYFSLFIDCWWWSDHSRQARRKERFSRIRVSWVHPSVQTPCWRRSCWRDFVTIGRGRALYSRTTKGSQACNHEYSDFDSRKASCWTTEEINKCINDSLCKIAREKKNTVKSENTKILFLGEGQRNSELGRRFNSE